MLDVVVPELVVVSIRSPHKSKGRRGVVPPISTRLVFQSAPLTKARGDSVGRSARGSGVHVFQSAPLTKARGDLPTNWFVRSESTFQSAPLTKARGDRQRLLVRIRHTSFNPLPSQKQGETDALAGLGGAWAVSIRSPHKSKGRPASLFVLRLTKEFQSAPLTKARGDLHDPLSPPPPSAFQSAPLTKARGDNRIGGQPNNRLRFNPLPSQKQGETSTFYRQSNGDRVSIRSPHKSKGRPTE